MSQEQITDIIDVDGKQVIIANCRAITVEQKPKRGDNGQLFVNRVPNGALCATGKDGNTYWRESADAPWERC